MDEQNIRRFASEVLPAIHSLSDVQYRGFEPRRRSA
jgi:hypothetical protein